MLPDTSGASASALAERRHDAQQPVGLEVLVACRLPIYT
jgi:hypothetical protein